MPVPCLRDDSPRDLEPSDEALFLQALGLAKARGFDWTKIPPEDRGDWARRALAWESNNGRTDR